jgi:predicted SprT family Zn-dependent metalloprotease
MDKITPINAELQQQVVERTLYYIKRAEMICGRRFAVIPVLFDLRGLCAGMYRVKNGQRQIRYNPRLFAKYFEDNLNVTVPHEVAHYVIDCLFNCVLQLLHKHEKALVPLHHSPNEMGLFSHFGHLFIYSPCV